MSLDLALVVCKHPEGADYAFADARDSVGDQPWMHEIAFVEHHRHDRLIVRGNMGGHYVDLDDRADVVGPKVGKGALTGAMVGALFGPPGFAAGLAGGAMVGGLEESNEITAPTGAFFDEVRADVPQGSSAIVLLADAGLVDAMTSAFDQARVRVVRHSLSDSAVRTLQAAFTGSPGAAPETAP
jgi:uncharacterized membrane protein